MFVPDTHSANYSSRLCTTKSNGRETEDSDLPREDTYIYVTKIGVRQ